MRGRPLHGGLTVASHPQELIDQLAAALRRANSEPCPTPRPPGAWSPEACAVMRESSPELRRLFYAALCFELQFRRYAKPSDIDRIEARAAQIDASTAEARAMKGKAGA